jgi:hypothetical protein
LQDGISLVVPDVNGERALEHDSIVTNPNCCTIPLTIVLKPLHDAAGLARVRVSTYQSRSGAGIERMDKLRETPSAEAHLDMDWDFDGARLEAVPQPRDAVGIDDVLLGRIREDETTENGLFSSSPATTCARVPHSTRFRSPGSCSSAAPPSQPDSVSPASWATRPRRTGLVQRASSPASSRSRTPCSTSHSAN